MNIVFRLSQDFILNETVKVYAVKEEKIFGVEFYDGEKVRIIKIDKCEFYMNHVACKDCLTKGISYMLINNKNIVDSSCMYKIERA